MRGAIRKLFGASCLFILLALSASYFGHRQGVAHQPTTENALARQFAGDPGDGLVLLGGFLMLIAVAVAVAAAMLWIEERRGGS